MPYINTIDINGTTYNLENLTDGNYVVDLPYLNKNDIFLLRGDVVDNLSSEQKDKPISANQGRVLDSKNTDLNNRVNDLKEQLENKDSELGNKIEQLRTDMGTSDTSTLNTSKSYTDEKSSEILTAANQHTDDSCNTINEAVTELQNVVERNKATSDSNKSELEQKITDLKTYSNDTFIAKTSIVDNLTTDSNKKVLSAKQGKMLDEKKFDCAGGTISGDVTIAGTLTISDSTKGISVTKVPVKDADVANKKYVDDADSKLNATLIEFGNTVGTHTTQITTIQQEQNNQSATLTDLQGELSTVKEQTKYEKRTILTNMDGSAVITSFELPENCVVWICITPNTPKQNDKVYNLNYSKMLYAPAIGTNFYYNLQESVRNQNQDVIEVELTLTQNTATSKNILNISITAIAQMDEMPFNVCVVYHTM